MVVSRGYYYSSITIVWSNDLLIGYYAYMVFKGYSAGSFFMDLSSDCLISLRKSLFVMDFLRIIERRRGNRGNSYTRLQKSFIVRSLGVLAT